MREEEKAVVVKEIKKEQEVDAPIYEKPKIKIIKPIVSITEEISRPVFTGIIQKDNNEDAKVKSVAQEEQLEDKKKTEKGNSRVGEDIEKIIVYKENYNIDQAGSYNGSKSNYNKSSHNIVNRDYYNTDDLYSCDFNVPNQKKTSSQRLIDNLVIILKSKKSRRNQKMRRNMEILKINLELFPL